jgi:hypothetical protein
VQSEILKADPKTRQRHILFMVVGVVMGGIAGYLANNYWLVLGIVYGVMWLVVANLIYQGIRILRGGQSPSPNAKVFRDTPVLRGKAARHRAFILMGLAAILVALLIILAMMGVRLLELLTVKT